MKICFLLLLTLQLSGCQSPGTKQNTQKGNQTADYINVNIDSEPPLRVPSLKLRMRLTTAETMKAVSERRALLGRLWQLSPIPVPGPNNAQVISAEVAHDRYVNFVTTYATDTILPLFQQRYARMLLNEYHWLETGRTDVIAYYVDQLLVSRSADSQTIVKGLLTLNGRLPVPRFVRLRDRALPLLEEQLAIEQNRLSALSRLPAQYRTHKTADINEAQRRAAMLVSAQRELPKIRQLYARDSTGVAQLRALKIG